jgi:hypothetical protein
MTSKHVDTAELDYATGIARQVCARVFRDGGTPADALEAFGIAHVDAHGSWRSAVDTIAVALCSKQRRAVAFPAFKAAA